MKNIIIAGYFFLFVPFIVPSQKTNYHTNKIIKNISTLSIRDNSEFYGVFIESKILLPFKENNLSSGNKRCVETQKPVKIGLSNIKYAESRNTGLYRDRNIYIIIISIICIIVILIVLIIKAKIQIENAQKELRKKEQILFGIQEKEELSTKGTSDSSEEIIKLAKANDAMFLPKFRETYPSFVLNLLKKYPYLHNSEFLLCTMTFLDFSPKEIAKYTLVNHRSIQTRKSRLRKKMNLEQNEDFNKHIKSFA